MKILIATGIYPPTDGGPATYSKALFDELPKRGFEVKVETFDHVRHLPKVIRHIVYFFKLLAQAPRADIIYAQDPVSVGFPALIVAKLTFRKFYLKVVGDYAWEQGTQRANVTDNLDVFSTKTDYSTLVKILKRVQSFVARNAFKVIVPSNYLKKIVTNWGIDPQKIKVIYNAFEGKHLPRESREVLRKNLGLMDELIISVGRLVPWKGFNALIEVVADLLKDTTHLKLLIMGDGPDRKKLQAKIDALNLGDAILLAGKIPQQELFKYIKAADVFVLNTQYEGFSHLLLEAMALGTPIVTTAVGGNVEIIEHDKNGLLISYNDKEALRSAILTVLKMEGEGKRLSSEAEKKVAAFTKDRMIDELVEEFNS